MIQRCGKKDEVETNGLSRDRLESKERNLVEVDASFKAKRDRAGQDKTRQGCAPKPRYTTCFGCLNHVCMKYV